MRYTLIMEIITSDPQATSVPTQEEASAALNEHHLAGLIEQGATDMIEATADRRTAAVASKILAEAAKQTMDGK